MHRGLILQKVLLMIKMTTKQPRKNTTHMLMKQIVYFMHAIQKTATEKILVKGLQISEHMLLRDNTTSHDHHNTCYQDG